MLNTLFNVGFHFTCFYFCQVTYIFNTYIKFKVKIVLFYFNSSMFLLSQIFAQYPFHFTCL